MAPMRTFDELETAWTTADPPPRDVGTVRALCLRTGDGHHDTPPSVEATPADGLAGDRWAARDPGTDPHGATAVTLMNATAAMLVADGKPIDTAGDNVYVDLDIGVDNLPPGTRLAIGSAVLRVSEEPHTGCTRFRDRFGLDALRWVSTPEGRARRLRGMNCSVEQAGTIRVGDVATVAERPGVTTRDRTHPETAPA
jgi:MOSC domain-containing protein YiiM